MTNVREEGWKCRFSCADSFFSSFARNRYCLKNMCHGPLLLKRRFSSATCGQTSWCSGLQPEPVSIEQHLTPGFIWGGCSHTECRRGTSSMIQMFCTCKHVLVAANLLLNYCRAFSLCLPEVTSSLSISISQLRHLKT